MLAVIYTILLGLLSACFVECGIYAFFPAPKQPEYRQTGQPGDSPVETLRSEREWEEYRESAERHSIRHYVMSLLGSSALAAIALRWHSSLGVLADGILLGAVFTLGTGTVFGIAGGGRSAKFAVSTVSLIVALGLGWTEFLPHTL